MKQTKTTLRILTVCRSLDLGGTERAAETFTLGYRDAGHETAVLNLGQTGPREENLCHHGVTVYHDLVEAERFAPDVVHIHRRGQADPAESAVLLQLRTAKRRVLETNVFAWADYSTTAELIDVHLLLSRWCLWAWRRRLGRDAPALVLANPLNAAQFRRADAETIARFREKWAPGATFVCGRVAQPLPGKWHPTNFLSFAALAQKDPKACLLLIGVPDSFRPLLNNLPTGVRSRIRELPMTSSDGELSLFYSSLDCFLHAANQGESFGYVLAEAMMCGCPVVTVSLPTRDNSQVEVVGHEKGGLVAGSFDGIGDALMRLREDAGLLGRLAAGCRRRIVGMCDVEQQVSRVLRAAEIALACDDKHAIRQAIEAERGFVTRVSEDEIRALAANVLGEARGLRWMGLANSPAEHRLRQFIRRHARR